MERSRPNGDAGNPVMSEGLPTRASRKQRPPAPGDYLPWVLIGLLVAKAALLRWVGFGGLQGLAGTWLEVALLAFLVCGAALIPWGSRAIQLLIYAVWSIVLCANAIYVAYFQQLFDPAMIALVGEFVDTAGEVAIDIFQPVNWLFVLDLPLVIAYAVWLNRRQARLSRKPVLAIFAASAVALAIQVALVLSVPAGIDTTSIAAEHGTGPTQLVELVAVAFPRRADAVVPRRAGVAGSTTATATRSPSGSEASGTPTSSASAYWDARGPRGSLEGSRVVDFAPGTYRGLPVLMVQVEALQTMLVNGRVQGKAVAPNFSDFAKESWYFPNTYSQTGAGNTCDAEFIANTGLLPPLTRPASVVYVNRELTGLPRLLRAQGYDAYTMHTNTARFWNRRELYPALGFTEYFHQPYFKDRDEMLGRASDAVLFQEAEKVLVRRSKETTRPVLLELVTITTHAPFRAPPSSRRPLKLSGAAASSTAGRYVTSFSFVDAEFGKFIDHLRASGMLDKMIVVVYGDHTGYQESFPAKEDAGVLRSLLGRDYGHVDRQRVPVMVRLPGGKGGVVEQPRAMVDIMPGVADLLGLDLSLAPNVGTSLFIETERLFPERYYYRGGSYVSGTTLFVNDPKGVRAYDILTNERLSDFGGYEDGREEARKLNALSESYVQALPTRKTKSLGNARIPGQDTWQDTSPRE